MHRKNLQRRSSAAQAALLDLTDGAQGSNELEVHPWLVEHSSASKTESNI